MSGSRIFQSGSLRPPSRIFGQEIPASEKIRLIAGLAVLPMFLNIRLRFSDIRLTAKIRLIDSYIFSFNKLTYFD